MARKTGRGVRLLLAVVCAAWGGCKTTQQVPLVSKGFSVSESQKVVFAKGNLQYNHSTQKWSLARQQYDMTGEAKTGCKTHADKTDLFGWSGCTGSAKWGISTSKDCADYAGDFVEWGKHIGDGTTYRTLTYEEWHYLLTTRPNASNLQGVVRIQLCHKKYADGLILLPDSWTCPTGVTFKSGFSSSFSVQAYTDYQTFTLAEWKRLEAAGAVFLPAAGSRSGASVHDVQLYGFYWSATAYGADYAYRLNFFSSGAGTDYGSRDYGRAVRLVQEVGQGN